VNSGDVSIFYRAFGSRGATPILLMHGANYFDSYDWIGIGGALSGDREVAAFDRRGWGESAWSPSKDYSLDAHVSDALAVMGAMQWQQAIVIGHSASGRTSMSLAANFPDKVARLIVLDSPLGGEIGTPRGPTVGNPPLMFGSIEAAMASFEKLSSPPRIGHDHERAPHALIRTEHGFMLKRDPDNGNSRPVGADAGVPRRPNRDVWQDLAAVRAPTLYVRAVRSDRLTDAMIERLTREHPKVTQATVDSHHDIADQVPEALLAQVRKFAQIA
jgi:pimeloyl-ACP methyl ester carboxylesterase